MAKTVSLNEFTYSAAAVLSGKLTTIAEKPVSLGMAIHIAVAFFDYLLITQDFAKNLKEKIFSGQILSPQDFDRYWDIIFKEITQKGSG